MKKPSKNRSEKKIEKSGKNPGGPGEPRAREDYLNQQDTCRHPTERQHTGRQPEGRLPEGRLSS